jgi:hypothetical protein
MIIETEPIVSAFRSKMEFHATALIFAAIGLILIAVLEFGLLFLFAGPLYQLPRSLVLPNFLAAAIPGYLIGFWLAGKQLKKQFWRLTDTELSCGVSRPQSFPLANIEKIIVGLPDGPMERMAKRARPGTAAGTTVAVLSTVDPRWGVVENLYNARGQTENSLLICFKDGSWLPLRLFLLPNGTAIMDELKMQFSRRLIRSYNYSADEVRRLRRYDVNELIPAPKPSRN